MPSSKSSSKPNPGCGMVKGGKYSPPNLAGTNPLRQQFEPTDAQPIRQRARMGGDPMGEANASNAAAREAAGEAKRVPDIKNTSDVTLHKKAAEGDKFSKELLLKRINDPVRFIGPENN